MSRRTVEWGAGEYYHFYNRGHNRERIFYERENYRFFLQQLHKYLLAVLDIVAYCLMPTHYHLLVRLKETGVSHRMQLLSISHTKAMNTRYERAGALYQGAFQAKLVNENEYLVHLSRYVHLNPVVAGLAKRPEEWEFSSYREYIGMRAGKLPTPDIVLSQFPSPEAYREFVESYVPEDHSPIDGLLFEE
ncbi:MAG: transposase [Thermoflexales bacterium]|nr:transposase [Thermoflexales bacterium]